MRDKAPGEPARGVKPSDIQFKAMVVATILDSRTEEALKMLCARYRVDLPNIGVGVVAGRTKGVAAVYSLRKKRILAAKREYLYNPFVVIHEFYHHLRSTSGKHRGTEKEADRFAADFVGAYKMVVASAHAEGAWKGDSGARGEEPA